jgi:hypothetical protein
MMVKRKLATVFLRIRKALLIGAVMLASSCDLAQAEVVGTGPVALTGEDVNAFRMAVTRCWNVGGLPADALSMVVVVRATLDRDGKPVPHSIRMEAFEGGTADAARIAFEAARRAIIRCGVDGYDLPPESYDQWKDLSLVFDMNGMQMP